MAVQTPEAVLLRKGSEANPSLRFEDDEDTGFYHIGAGIIGLAINGFEVTRWTASGPSQSQNVVVEDGFGLLVGATSQITGDSVAEIQELGSATADSSALIGRFSADAAGPQIEFVKSRHATVGSNTIVQDNDVIGRVVWLPADGTDFATVAAVFQAEVDDGSPAADRKSVV